MAVCFAFQRGECDRGNTCKFSHGGSDTGDIGGGARKAAGVCFAFQTGECDRGERCRFLHEVGDVPADYGDPSERGACYAFQRGTCDRGDTCRFAYDITRDSEQPLPDVAAQFS